MRHRTVNIVTAPVKLPVLRVAAFFILSTLSLSTLSVTVSAAGFQVSETSVAGLGLAFAGVGISADGPADLFYNPAGLMLGDGREMEIGVHWIAPNAEFENQGSTLTTTMMTVPLDGRDSNGGENAVVPNFYYAAEAGVRLGKRMRYGIGLTSPFGLTTEYDPAWVGRYHAIKTELIAVEINPVVAFQVNDFVSIGAGLTVTRAEAELSRALDTRPHGDENDRSTVTGDDTAFGFNFGITAGDENSRIGLGYRSRTDLEIEGKLSVDHLSVLNGGANADLTLPATIYLSAFQKLNEKLDFLATVRWTDWSEFEELRIEFDNGSPDSVTPENWKDSLTYSIGLRYQANDRWTLRGGYARDETPIKDDKYRTPRIPDTDRDWFAFGASYQATAKTRVDFAFTHLFTESAPVHECVASTGRGMCNARLIGTFDNTETNILAVQLHFTLGATPSP